MARTEKILNGKLLFLCSVGSIFQMFHKIKGALILFCALFFWYVVFHTWNEYGNLLNSRIQSKCGEIRTRKNSEFVHFSSYISAVCRDMMVCFHRVVKFEGVVLKHFQTKFRFSGKKNIFWYSPAGNYMFKVNNRNTRTSCEIYSKVTIRTPEWRHASFWCVYC